MSSEDLQDKIPPYGSWQTLESFIERLNGTVTPPIIDNSILPHLSGGSRSTLMVALRFLRLIEGEGVVTERLRKLVAAYGTEQWKAELQEVVLGAYIPVLGSLDISTGTASQLENSFRAGAGISGETVRKCIRFYLSALIAAGVTFSPYFAARRSRADKAGNKPQKKPVRKNGREQPNSETERPATRERPYGPGFPSPEGMTRLDIPIPGKHMATIIVPESLTEEEWSMLDNLFRSYAKLRDKAKP